MVITAQLPASRNGPHWRASNFNIGNLQQSIKNLLNYPLLEKERAFSTALPELCNYLQQNNGTGTKEGRDGLQAVLGLLSNL
jgi:hypothetical protein